MNTTTEQLVGYVNSGGRGTLDLIWSCLVTICLCTWTIQRPDVVPWTTKKTAVFRKRIFWMTITLFCPEYLAWVAIDQWQSARKFKLVQQLGYPSFTMKHAFYVAMGGLVIQINTQSRTDEHGDPIGKRKTVQYPIYMDDLLILLRSQIIQLPEITEQELEERSKSDNFARFITAFHVITFVAHSFGRLGSGLPISPLEVSTLAFVCPAAAIEFFWWKKPLNLRSFTTVQLPAQKEQAFLSLLDSLSLCPSEQTLADQEDFKTFWGRVSASKDCVRRAVHIVWIGCIFNGVHIMAWNFKFPTPVEIWLWRCCSLTACAAIVEQYLALFLGQQKLTLLLTAGLGTPLYLISRMYLMVEACVSLRSVSPAMYQSSSWQKELSFL